ncbi:MAG: hypothetical protein ACUVTD_09650 [Nitrososphaerales archaeon]
MTADRFYNFFYRHPNIVLFLLVMSEMFIFAIYLSIFPSTLSRPVASEILRILIDFDGVLIGFSVIVGTLIIIRPGREVLPGITRHIALSLGSTIMFFIFSVLASIYYLAMLDVRSFLNAYDLGLPLTFMVVALTVFFIMIALAYPPKKI